MADGFLGRWSQRKQAQRQGVPLAEPIDQQKTVVDPVISGDAAIVSGSKKAPDAAAVDASGQASSRPPVPRAVAPVRATTLAEPGLSPGPAALASPRAPEAAPAPTLADVQALQPEDSFARFVAPDVPPQVRNAAMKKLFADPHYNVMDGLDIYIDDYSIASPLPAATLRQMASAKFLKLFDEEPAQTQGPAPAALGEDAHTARAPSVAESAHGSNMPDTHATLSCEPVANSATDNPNNSTSHDNPDLRLQPDHAAGPARLEREPERTADAAQQPVPPRSG